MPVHVGANSLKKPHHIVILRFSEVVKGHAKYGTLGINSFYYIKLNAMMMGLFTQPSWKVMFPNGMLRMLVFFEIENIF